MNINDLKKQDPFKDNPVKGIWERSKLTATPSKYLLSMDKETLASKCNVEIKELIPTYFNCYSYMTRINMVDVTILDTLVPKREDSLIKFSPGDVIWYIKRKEAVHTGVINQDGTITSQWGRLYVLSHPFNFVPFDYSVRPEYRFSRRPSKEEVFAAQKRPQFLNAV